MDSRGLEGKDGSGQARSDFVPVERRGVLYIATGEQGEWVRHVNPTESQITDLIKAMPHDETSIVSFGWPDKSYLSIRRQPGDVWQMMSRAKIGWFEVLTEEHLSGDTVLQVAITFATQLRLLHQRPLRHHPEAHKYWTTHKLGPFNLWHARPPPWKADHPWRSRQAHDQLWEVTFRRRLSAKFWKAYAIGMAGLVVAILVPFNEFTKETLPMLTGCASVVCVAALTYGVTRRVWIAGLHAVGRVLGAMPSFTPVPVWEDMLLPTQQNSFAYDFFEPQTPWKVLALPVLLLVNLVLCIIAGAAVFLTIMWAILTYGSKLVG